MRKRKIVGWNQSGKHGNHKGNNHKRPEDKDIEHHKEISCILMVMAGRCRGIQKAKCYNKEGDDNKYSDDFLKRFHLFFFCLLMTYIRNLILKCYYFLPLPAKISLRYF